MLRSGQFEPQLGRPQLIFVMLPVNAADCRRIVKHWGDIKIGISTQCVVSIVLVARPLSSHCPYELTTPTSTAQRQVGTVQRPVLQQRRAQVRGSHPYPYLLKDSYADCCHPRINSRLGGVNSAIDSPFNDVFKDSMVIGEPSKTQEADDQGCATDRRTPTLGADVGHPGPGLNNRPSVTGLVATVDPDVNVMTSAARIQRPRLEIIQDLHQMVFVRLAYYLAVFACSPVADD